MPTKDKLIWGFLSKRDLGKEYSSKRFSERVQVFRSVMLKNKRKMTTDEAWENLATFKTLMEKYEAAQGSGKSVTESIFRKIIAEHKNLKGAPYYKFEPTTTDNHMMKLVKNALNQYTELIEPRIGLFKVKWPSYKKEGKELLEQIKLLSGKYSTVKRSEDTLNTIDTDLEALNTNFLEWFKEGDVYILNLFRTRVFTYVKAGYGYDSSNDETVDKQIDLFLRVLAGAKGDSYIGATYHPSREAATARLLDLPSWDERQYDEDEINALEPLEFWDLIEDRFGVRGTPLKERVGPVFMRLLAAGEWYEAGKMLNMPGEEASHFVDDEGNNTLHFANDPGIARRLLMVGIDVSHRNVFGQTPVHTITDGDTLRMVLSEYNAFPHTIDNNGNMPISFRVGEDNMECVKILMQHGNTDPLVNLPNFQGRTLIHKARSQEMVAFLAKIGADLFAVDKNGMNALHAAAERGDEGVISAILSIHHKFGIDATDKNGDTALAISCRKSLYCAEILMLSGADRTIKNAAGQTVLGEAIAKGVVEIAEFLSFDPLIIDQEIQGNYDIQLGLILLGDDFAERILSLFRGPPIVSDDGDTLLHGAIKGTDSLAIITEVVLADQSMVHARNRFGETALHMQQKKRDVVDFLISSGADPMARDNNGRTPLIALILYGPHNPNDYLFPYGYIDAAAVPDNFGNTPLHYIARIGRCKELIDPIANHPSFVRAAKNDSGDTPLHLARTAEYARMIMKYSFLHATNNNGQTALLTAIQRDAKDVGILLKSLRDIPDKWGRTVADYLSFYQTYE